MKKLITKVLAITLLTGTMFGQDLPPHGCEAGCGHMVDNLGPHKPPCYAETRLPVYLGGIIIYYRTVKLQIPCEGQTPN